MFNTQVQIKLSVNNFVLQLLLSQDDITTILRTLNENLGDSSGTSHHVSVQKDQGGSRFELRSSRHTGRMYF